MSQKPHRSESGQSLMLLVFAMVAMMGFAALAIDGGMVYADRRHAQNAADTGSLAGAGKAALTMENASPAVMYDNWRCNGYFVRLASYDAQVADLARVASNGYTIDADFDDYHGAEVACVNSFNGSFHDRYLDVVTFITTETRTSFAQFVFSGPLVNRVEARARVRPRSPFAFGHAIVSLNTDPNCTFSGIELDGAINVNVTGGGIFSNSCITANGTTTVGVNNNFDIACTLEDCYTKTGFGTGTISPTPTEDTEIPLPAWSYQVPAPDCSALPARTQSGSTLNPGRYTQISMNNGTLHLNPGLYCIDGGNFDISGGEVTGSNLTIFLTSGSFQTTGNSLTMLSAPPARDCGDACKIYSAIPGVLIYLAEDNASQVILRGTSEANFLGLIFAPDGKITAGGTASEMSEINAQLVAKDIKVHGNTDLIINFNGQMNYQVPAMVELSK